VSNCIILIITLIKIEHDQGKAETKYSNTEEDHELVNSSNRNRYQLNVECGLLEKSQPVVEFGHKKEARKRSQFSEILLRNPSSFRQGRNHDQ